MVDVEEEVAAAPAPENCRLHYLDLVRFEPAGEGDEQKKHGDRGLVVYSDPEKMLMCIDGAVVDKEGSVLVVLDRSSLYPGMHVASASEPDGQIGVVAADLVEHKVDAAPSPGAQVEKKENPYKNQLRKFFFKKDMRTPRWGGRVRAVEKTMVVSVTSTTADVLWQDGTLRRGVPSLDLVPFAVVNAHEFLPGQHVVVDTMAAEPTDGSAATARRVGVVRSVDPKDQTVSVSWLEPRGARREETVGSAYDLRKYSQHDVFYGDVVVRLLPQPLKPAGAGEEAPPDAADLSWVGRVVDVRHGHVQVQWGDGETSTALHHEVRAVDMRTFLELEYEVGPWLADERHRAAARAQPPPAAAANNNAANNVAAANNNAANNVAAGNTGGPSGGANIPAPSPTLTGRVGAAVQWVIEVASQLLIQGRSYLLSGSSSSSSSEALVNGSSSSSSSSAAAATSNEARGNAEAAAPSGPAAGGDVNVEHGNGVATEAATTTAAAVASSDVSGGDAADDSAAKGKTKMDAGEDEPLGFAHFDVVQSPPDHHYLDSKREDTAQKSKWVKRVQKEWQILGDDNLPGTIYVRAFEDRMDLLRAAMVSAAGTPYHDGLFLFDLHLPPSYPAAPPQVYYHSFGLRVNPNLYPSGTICLSLLNTFDGDGTEAWQPATSTLLQVLVSVQGLVLTADPYYNEAGYDAYVGTPEGRRNAFSYAENSCLLTLRTALHLLRRPPRGFEDLVRGHFRRRGRHVLAACESYLRGARVAGDAERTCSVGFRLALGNVVPMLVEAFMEIGAEGCDRFVGELGHCPAPEALTTHDDAASSRTTD
ncbi:hypothetical protein E2562_017264 [Oryza meyeriana var. granulata]|uniref:UBC core domain-containing protein n=1 Tax=Oryza meyeriana var. granulata TaxID=110450 RepID=A0A6G1ELH7_9ORYZ|nr:hypothetical protein E2562_017264 [Oryza meyeriana var. granulata]